MPYFGNNPSPLLLNTLAQNGKELTLDADADTSITADTDDQIDIKIGGSDIFQLTASKLDINGKELVLDADADTSITADTDDQIDIRIGGADDFQFTANTFTAQSGSTIAAQALTATTITASGIVKTDDATDATSTTDGSLQTDGGLSVTKDAVIGDDLLLLSDSAAIKFGADSEITLTHDADQGLTIKHASSADNKMPLLTLAAGDNDISANDVLGQIRWIAPDEGTGTDAVTMAANIQVVSEGDFAADNNAVYMSFATGSSGAATDKLFLDSNGFVGIGTSTPSVYNSYGNGFIVKKAGAGASHAGMSIISATDGYGSIYFNDGTGNNTHGAIDYNHSTDHMRIRTGGATGIEIDDNGAVTKPKNPMFWANGNANNNVANSSSNAYHVYQFPAETYDIGGGYNTSNGRYVAPVAGKYFVTVKLLIQGLNASAEYYTDIIISRNGSQVLKETYEANYYARAITVALSGIVHCDASDYLEVKTRLENHSNQVVYEAATTAMFQGFLIG